MSQTIERKYKACNIERYVTICWVRHDFVEFHFQVVWYTKSPWILHKVWMLGHNKTLILTSTNPLQQVRICTCSAAWSSRSSRWDRPAATPSLWTQAVSPWGSRGGRWAWQSVRCRHQSGAPSSGGILTTSQTPDCPVSKKRSSS